MKPYDKRKTILFSTPMVQALLNTKPNVWPAEPIDPSKLYKWQTRRVIKPRYRAGETGFEVARGESGMSINIIGEEGSCIREEQPKYWPGDVLWVRETWKTIAYSNESGYEICVKYRADNTESNWIDLDDEELWERIVDQEEAWRKHHANETKWRPSIFMPRVAARLFLEVKNVRIERLRDITLHPGDFRAEGIPDTGYMLPGEEKGEPHKLFELSVTWRFRRLWNHLNAKRGYPWDNNPWVWVYEFMRVKP